MSREYSANQELLILSQNLGLGFELYVFDEGDGTTLHDKGKNAEVDAIMLYKNLFCVISVDKSANPETARKKVRRFQEKLDRVTSYTKFKPELKVVRKAKGTTRVKQVKDYLEKTRKHTESLIAKDYRILFRKIFFAPNVKFEEEIIDVYKKKEIIILDKDVFDYFDAVFRRLGKAYLFYHLIHFLEVKKLDFEKRSIAGSTSAARTRSYPALEYKLEKDKIYMYPCALRAEDIKEYITVLRMAHKYDRKGFQRMIKNGRLEEINRGYLARHYTFPNNVIIAFSPEFYARRTDFWDSRQKEIRFVDDYNSLIIIDGQHRFFSLINGNKEDRPILITFLFFRPSRRDSEYTQMERMFYKINKTQERIDPNLSFAIKARIDLESAEAFWYPVFKSLDRQGFFARRFSFRESSLRTKGEPRSIVSVIQYGGVLQLNDDKRRRSVDSPGLKMFYGKSRHKNIELATNIINNYFAIVEEITSKEGLSKDQLGIREIGALIRILRHFIISDPAKVKELGRGSNLEDIKSDATDYFRDHLGVVILKDVINLAYPASNWAAIEGYMLKKIHHTKNPNFGNIVFLSRKGLEVYNAV